MNTNVKAGLLATLLIAAGCTTPQQQLTTVNKEINKSMDADLASSSSYRPQNRQAVRQADEAAKEKRIDLIVSDTPAQQVFMALAHSSKYNILVDPGVSGTMTLDLKDTTTIEALEAIRMFYGYEYDVIGKNIMIQPLGLQTKQFKVNYLASRRDGTSTTHVISGSVTDSASGSGGAPGTTTSGSRGKVQESSSISTTFKNDFWDELGNSLKAIIGEGGGRNVIVSPTTGIVIVKAMPKEMRNVTTYLKNTQMAIERQVILEAKIIEVQLNDSFQTGVNWNVFKAGQNSAASLGQVSPGSAIGPRAGGAPAQVTGVTNGSAATGLVNSVINAVPGAALAGAAGNPGTLMGLAFQTSNFSALLNFLETQGDVRVLSSPRIATTNNQKAVLKVGDDSFFVTNVQTSTTTGTATTTTPSVTLQPFFSGIALDVTPQISDNGEVVLHIHPSVSQVKTVNQTLNLGGSAGTMQLPLASSNVSETDSIVRAKDGQIVALGGLMRNAAYADASGVPGAPKSVFGQTNSSIRKQELVILLKPTIVDSNDDWTRDIAAARTNLIEAERKE